MHAQISEHWFWHLTHTSCQPPADSFFKSVLIFHGFNKQSTPFKAPGELKEKGLLQAALINLQRKNKILWVINNGWPKDKPGCYSSWSFNCFHVQRETKNGTDWLSSVGKMFFSWLALAKVKLNLPANVDPRTNRKDCASIKKKSGLSNHLPIFSLPFKISLPDGYMSQDQMLQETFLLACQVTLLKRKESLLVKQNLVQTVESRRPCSSDDDGDVDDDGKQDITWYCRRRLDTYQCYR